MGKIIRITMPDASIWDVPAEVVAFHRALAMAQIDSNGDEPLFRTIFCEEFDTVYSDDSELLDWAQNHMSWGDIEYIAERVGIESEMDYESGWKNGSMTVIDKDEITNY